MSTGKIPTGLIKCNSLSENPLISKEKFDGIVTNPPFGTDMNYQELKKYHHPKIAIMAKIALMAKFATIPFILQECT